MKSLITLSESPSVAITNENSPICAMPSPERNAVRASWPTTKTPRLHASVLPTITLSAISNRRQARQESDILFPAQRLIQDHGRAQQIGRASCRERVCQSV